MNTERNPLKIHRKSTVFFTLSLVVVFIHVVGNSIAAGPGHIVGHSTAAAAD